MRLVCIRPRWCDSVIQVSAALPTQQTCKQCLTRPHLHRAAAFRFCVFSMVTLVAPTVSYSLSVFKNYLQHTRMCWKCLHCFLISHLLLPPHFEGHKPQDGLKCTSTGQCPDISLWSMGPLMLHSCYPSQPEPVSGCSNRNLKQLM